MIKYKGLWYYSLWTDIYIRAIGGGSFPENTLAWVNTVVLNVITWNMTNNIKLGVDVDLYAYCTKHVFAYIQDV